MGQLVSTPFLQEKSPVALALPQDGSCVAAAVYRMPQYGWLSRHNLGCLLSQTQVGEPRETNTLSTKTPKYGYFTHKEASQTCYQ